MNSKLCTVTGATAGMGLVTARELARMGASVILVGRNHKRSRHVVEAIPRVAGNRAVQFDSPVLAETGRFY